MLRQFNPERCGNGARVLGVARSALAATVRHLRSRRQFGRELAEFQGLRWKVADMATRLEAACLRVARAADADEDGFPPTRYTAMAKILATETAQWICDQAIQLHGQSGYTRELPIERYFRDVRGMSLAGDLRGHAQRSRGGPPRSPLRLSPRPPSARPAVGDVE